jgi:hypothetical protein
MIAASKHLQLHGIADCVFPPAEQAVVRKHCVACMRAGGQGPSVLCWGACTFLPAR